VGLAAAHFRRARKLAELFQRRDATNGTLRPEIDALRLGRSR